MHTCINCLEKVSVLFCFLLAAGSANAQSFEHPGGLHSRSQIATARTNISARTKPVVAAYESLIEQAKRGLERTPEPVEVFNIPAYYKNAEAHIKAASCLNSDAWAAYSCAIAYQLTPGKERSQYAEKTVKILDAWAMTNKKATGEYGSGDLVMAYAGVGLVFAAELMTDYDGWTKEQRTVFRQWVSAVYLKSCKKIAGRPNNWGDWGILGYIASHYFLDSASELDADIKRIRSRIDNAIAADGSIPEETKREKNGIWYTYFSLAPLTAACQIALNARDVDLFHYKGKDGTGIEQALDYLLIYSSEPEKWPHYRKDDISRPTPGEWPYNLYEAMSGIYGKKEYGACIKDAGPIMLHGHHYAWSVPTLMKTVPPQEKPQK